MSFDQDIYQKQGFGNAVAPMAPYGLLIVDFINGFADPLTFGGGNIGPAIECTRGLLAQARQRQWPIVHTRVVYQDDGADANIFSLKVPPSLPCARMRPKARSFRNCSRWPASWCCARQVPRPSSELRWPPGCPCAAYGPS